uniref:Flavodoxin-like fold domain-containing protein n=1 Tax=Astatotilapia calliptera TaxID=8154 RepID=A0AAX7V6D9_ASTCA
FAAKKVLIVYAHESPASFNAAAKDAAVAALTAQGCTVEVSDLYAMKFKAAATTEDITGGVKDAENFSYAKEIKLQEKLKEADLVIFQFPMYWSSVPAIMKGWMDRVLGCVLSLFAHSLLSVQDKKAMLSFTTDCPESVYSDTGINGDINVTLWPLQNGILNYCGFQVFAPQIFWDPATGSPESRSSMLEGWRTRLFNFLVDDLLPFLHLSSHWFFL